MKTILVNALGISDSGGISVFRKLLDELIINDKFKYFIVYHKSINIEVLLKDYSYFVNFEFYSVKSKNMLNRIYFENVKFREIIRDKKVKLIYNFSGSGQFFIKTPQLIKIHNLLFYCKNIDKVYFRKRSYFKWFTQIFLKRIVLHKMVKQSRYIEVQSSHVKEHVNGFINISSKKFFIKSDISVNNKEFKSPKNYNFSKKIKFLFIVGPHFQYYHKNIEDFVNAMSFLKENEIDFKIAITLTKEQLHSSMLWNKKLDNITDFLGYIQKVELEKQFDRNTILISTSVIETLGLHVIEAIQHGLLVISPNEPYSKVVYGNEPFSYELFNFRSLIHTINYIVSLDLNTIKTAIKINQQYLETNEKAKEENIVNIFEKIIKENNNV